MGRKAGLTRDEVVDTAAELADEVGLEQLTLAELASRLGIRPPSLYNHIEGIEGLRRDLALNGAKEFGAAIRPLRARHDPEDALRAVCASYRAFAQAHPGLYAATSRVENLVNDDEIWSELRVIIDELGATLADMGIPTERHIAVIRAIRSSLHGFVTLEGSGGLGDFEDVDASFESMIDLLIDGTRAQGPQPRRSSTPAR
jgi:AcrR family transcriptional regulator